MEDKIIELADYFISENTTYREAKIACEKLLKQVSHEIELRAMESKTRAWKEDNIVNGLGLIIVTIVNVVSALINLFCFIKDRIEWFVFENETNSLISLDFDFTW